MTIQDHLLKYLETQAKVIAALVPSLVQQKDISAVHNMRVATRRARAAIWILEQNSGNARHRKLNRNLRRLGKALGRVRELDVAIIDANKFGIDSPKLKLNRKIAHNRLRKFTNNKRNKDLANDFSALKRVVIAMKPTSVEIACGKLTTKLYRQCKRRIHGQTRLHHLRIVMKRARYVLEAVGKPTTPLKPLQKILGDAHDLEMLQEFIGKNTKIKMKQHLLNKKAEKLVKPALHFALNQLST